MNVDDYKKLVSEAHFQSTAYAVLEHLLALAENGSIEHWVLGKLHARAIKESTETQIRLLDQFKELTAERQQQGETQP